MEQEGLVLSLFWSAKVICATVETTVPATAPVLGRKMTRLAHPHLLLFYILHFNAASAPARNMMWLRLRKTGLPLVL
jgi:hypothetical protein